MKTDPYEIPADAKAKRVPKNEFYCEHSKCNDRENLNATRGFNSGDGDMTWRCEKHTPARFKRKRKPKARAERAALKDSRYWQGRAERAERAIMGQTSTIADYQQRVLKLNQENERLAGVIVRTEERAADAVMVKDAEIKELHQRNQELHQRNYMLEHQSSRNQYVEDLEGQWNSAVKRAEKAEKELQLIHNTEVLRDSAVDVARRLAALEARPDKPAIGFGWDYLKTLEHRLAALEGRVQSIFENHGPKIDWLLKAVGSLRGTIIGGAIPPVPTYPL